MSDVVEPFAVADALVKVTEPKSATDDSMHVGLQISGASTIHSADACKGGGEGSGTVVENVQLSVELVSVNVHTPAAKITFADMTLPGATG